MLTLTLTLTKGCAIPFSNYKNTFLWGKNQTGFFSKYFLQSKDYLLEII